MAPDSVYVYAMGMEPWLTYITSISYADDSPPILESNKFVAECTSRGIPCERVMGRKEILLTRADQATRNVKPIAIPAEAYEYVPPQEPGRSASERTADRTVSHDVSTDPQAEALTKLLQTLRELNVRLWVEDGKLKCDAPKGTMTSDLTEQIKSHKPALIELLKGIKPRSPVEDSIS